MRKLLGLMLISACAAPASGTLVTNLGVLSGDTWTAATDVNDAGVVAGGSIYERPEPFGGSSYEYHGFRWTVDGGIQPIGTLGGATGQSYANAINSTGRIVGWSATALGRAGVSYVPPGPVQQVASAGEATGINDNGVIVGFVPQAGVTQHAYRYDGTAVPLDLGVLGGTQSYARDVNNSGTVVGWSNINSSTVKKAFRFAGAGPMQPIPGLSNFIDSEALAINNPGDTVGYVAGGSAFRYTAAGTLVSLPGTSGVAWDINDAGYVVGSAGAVSHAALWTPANTLVDLDQWLDANDPVEGAKWTLTNGTGINAGGLIVGVGQYNDGAGGLSDGQRAYVLNAAALVPEPAAATLLLACGCGLLRRPRR